MDEGLSGVTYARWLSLNGQPSPDFKDLITILKTGYNICRAVTYISTFLKLFCPCC